MGSSTDFSMLASAPLLLQLLHALLFCDAAAATTAAAARFLKTPTAATAKLGSTVVLPCSIEGVAGSPQWTQNGFGLGTDRSLPAWERYKMTGLDHRRKCARTRSRPIACRATHPSADDKLINGVMSVRRRHCARALPPAPSRPCSPIRFGNHHSN